MHRLILLPFGGPCPADPGRLEPQLPSFLSHGIGPHTRLFSIQVVVVLVLLLPRLDSTHLACGT